MRSSLPGGVPPAARPMLWPWPTWPTLCSSPRTPGLRCAPGSPGSPRVLHRLPVYVRGACSGFVCGLTAASLQRHDPLGAQGWLSCCCCCTCWCWLPVPSLCLPHLHRVCAQRVTLASLPVPSRLSSPPPLPRSMLRSTYVYQGKDGAFMAKAAQEMSSLRKLQSDLEAETGNACFLGLSVASTIQQCLRLDNVKAALHVKSSFRVSERHFALLKVCLLPGSRLLLPPAALPKIYVALPEPSGCPASPAARGGVLQHGCPAAAASDHQEAVTWLSTVDRVWWPASEEP